MAASNERAFFMFEAVGAGLVECIRLAQADIHESAKQQQMTLKTQPHYKQQNPYHPYNPSYNQHLNHQETTIQSNSNSNINNQHHPMMHRSKTTTPPFMYDDSSLMRYSNPYHSQLNEYYDNNNYCFSTNASHTTDSTIDNDLKNSFSSSSTSTSFSTNNNSSSTNLNAKNHDRTTLDRSSRTKSRTKSFNQYLMHHISGSSPVLDDIICLHQQQQYHQQQQLRLQRRQSSLKRHHHDTLYSSDLDDHSAASSASSSSCDIEQQSKVALKYAQQLEAQLIRLDQLRDAYVTHLKMGQGAKTISRAYALSSASLSSASLGKLTSPRTQLASALSNGTINSKIVKASIKEFMENIEKIENELESMMGTFMLQIQSIQGFARICTGDVFEITIKYGDKQKFKTKIRVLKGDRQKCDHKEAIFKARINDVLCVKACECKGLGKKVLLGNKLCETKDLFTAHSQLMTISLNQTGSIKLNLVVTWNPLDISTSDSICNVNHTLSFTNK